MRGPRLFSGVLVTAALLALPASAGAVTFGANLDQRNANSKATCGYPPYYPGFFPLSNSCTFYSASTPTGQASEAQVVPLPDPAIHGNQSGTITAVRIKTGPYQAGPAKLTVLGAHREITEDEAACCVGRAESAQFTLTPNSIVHVATDLPVTSIYDAASRIYTYDTLALSVLDATTPIPGEFSGDQNGYCSTGYFPYVQTGQERLVGDYGICGFIVLMQADLTIKGDDTPTLRFPTTRGRIAGRTARIPLKCAGKVTCAGILRLQNTAARQGTAARKKVVTHGKGRFKIAPGGSHTVKVKLSKRARRLTRGRKTVRVYANATLSGGKIVFRKKIALRIR
jgi:hypothetical protein